MQQIRKSDHACVSEHLCLVVLESQNQFCDSAAYSVISKRRYQFDWVVNKISWKFERSDRWNIANYTSNRLKMEPRQAHNQSLNV